MALQQVYKKPNRTTTNVIIFVHGLSGSADTWDKDENSFARRLRREIQVADHYDLFIYEYHTRMVENSWIKRWKARIPGIKKKPVEFNTSIRDIAASLISGITTQLAAYDTIVLVAHSMGGLVTKSAMVQMNSTDLKKIKLVLSLSVPHAGSALAGNQIINLVGSNQVPDLVVFSALTNDLTGRYTALTEKPKVIYQRGLYDTVVSEGSAIPANTPVTERIDTQHTHFDVVEVADKNTHVPYITLLTALNDLLAAQRMLTGNEIADAPVNLGIPVNLSLKSTAEMMARQTGFDVVFEGFEQDVAEIIIKSGNLSAANTMIALLNLQFRVEGQVSPYEVSFVHSRFILKKK